MIQVGLLLRVQDATLLYLWGEDEVPVSEEFLRQQHNKVVSINEARGQIILAMVREYESDYLWPTPDVNIKRLYHVELAVDDEVVERVQQEVE